MGGFELKTLNLASSLIVFKLVPMPLLFIPEEYLCNALMEGRRISYAL